MLWGGWGWGWLGMASWSQRIHMMYVLVVASHWYSGKCGPWLSPLLSLPPSTPHELLHNNSNSGDCTQQQQQRVSTQYQNTCTMYTMWSVSSHVLTICKYKWVSWPPPISTHISLFAQHCHLFGRKSVIMNKKTFSALALWDCFCCYFSFGTETIWSHAIVGIFVFRAIPDPVSCSCCYYAGVECVMCPDHWPSVPSGSDFISSVNDTEICRTGLRVSGVNELSWPHKSERSKEPSVSVLHVLSFCHEQLE